MKKGHRPKDEELVRCGNEHLASHQGSTHLELLNGGVAKEKGSSKDSSQLPKANETRRPLEKDVGHETAAGCS